jgi:hypothetical protein
MTKCPTIFHGIAEGIADNLFDQTGLRPSLL